MLKLALLRARLSPRLRVFWARRRASLSATGVATWRRRVRKGRWPLTLGTSRLMPERYLRVPGALAWEPGVGSELSLEVAWVRGWKDLFEKVRVLREPLPALPEEATEPAFRDADVRLNQSRRRELLASVALHALFLSLPVPEILTRPPAYKPTFTTVRLEYDVRWTGTSPVLPPISPRPRPERKPGLGGQERRPMPPPAK